MSVREAEALLETPEVATLLEKLKFGARLKFLYIFQGWALDIMGTIS